MMASWLSTSGLTAQGREFAASAEHSTRNHRNPVVSRLATACMCVCVRVHACDAWCGVCIHVYNVCVCACVVIVILVCMCVVNW